MTRPTPETSGPVDSLVGTLSPWELVGAALSVMRADLTVPLDYDDPEGRTIEVPVWRRPASD
jgi:hypothetical protein